MQCGINMIFPKKLREGDKIGLVCPSSKIKAEDVIKCKESVEKLGFEPVFAKNINDAYAGYMAGDEKTRAYWINKMFEDDEIDGIFCIRGGDGSSRIMQYLDYDLISKKPKVFVGYSDVTNLLLSLIHISRPERNANCSCVSPAAFLFSFTNSAIGFILVLLVVNIYDYSTPFRVQCQ